MIEKRNSAIDKVEKIAGNYYDKPLGDEINESTSETVDEIRNEENGGGSIYKKTNGLISVIAFLSICVLTLVGALLYVFFTPTNGDISANSLYAKSFYDTIIEVDNIDTYLSKIIVTKDSSASQKYLLDTAINSELCENNLQQLPIGDESKFYTTKLVNQIGDFSKYLSNKISDGENLSEDDYKNLKQLYSANKELKNCLMKVSLEMGSDFDFSSMLNSSDNIIIENFNELQNLSVSFPELIYDGPFSDGKNNKEVKGLGGEEIDKNTATEIFAQIFGGFGLENVSEAKETDSDIASFNIEATVNGESLYAQISKKGGKLIMFSYSGSCKDTIIDDETAINNASKFLETLDIENMSAVWSSLSNNLYTINFAYTENDIIYYPDLIKVRVCAETGKIIGMEGTSYYYNHLKREMEEAKISVLEAEKMLSNELEIIKCRKCVVPIGESEKLCYEFSCVYNEEVYYVYIDAVNKKQVQIFKVIDSLDGIMLI